MTTLFEGGPDDRQTNVPVLAPQHSLFRKRYRQLSAADLELHDAIKDKADELAVLIAEVAGRLEVPGRSPGAPRRGPIESIVENQGANVTLALRHLEDAVYRAVKALTA